MALTKGVDAYTCILQHSRWSCKADSEEISRRLEHQHIYIT